MKEQKKLKRHGNQIRRVRFSSKVNTVQITVKIPAAQMVAGTHIVIVFSGFCQGVRVRRIICLPDSIEMYIVRTSAYNEIYIVG